MKTSNLKGIIYASLGATLFGISSVIATVLFQNPNVTPQWLVTMRMFYSGILLLGYLLFKKKDIFTIWKSLKSTIIIITLGIFGVLGAQDSFMLSIYYGNAAIATILQSMGPALILIFSAIFYRKFPTKVEICAISSSILGIFLLVTNGNINEIRVSNLAIIFGVFSAFGVCAYSLIPKKILNQQNSLMIVGWGLLIGGAISSLFNPVLKLPIAFNVVDLFLLTIIIILGTLMSYSLYINSLIYIEAHTASMLGILEPVVTILLSVALFRTSFLIFQMIGISMILLSLFIINIPSKV